MKVYLKYALIFAILSISIIAYAEFGLEFFTAKTGSDGIFIEWKSQDEDGVVYYEIERSADNPNSYLYLKTINATGNNSYYSYLDNNVMMKSSSTIYYYRLKCVRGNNSYFYTNHITVVHSVSGIKETWGSIKAIFR
ncbi:MAG: hypothetical protein FJ216_04850 [Ignavibacteria bacterium]|nr:hypothetical protein [Ignavibacteria bacterium]